MASIVAATIGCATWDVPETHREFRLPAPVVQADSIVYELAFIRWPAPTDVGLENHGDGGPNDLWRTLDEQFLTPEAREHLAANGIRVGVLSDPLPDSVRLELERTKDPLAIISGDEATAGAEVLTRRERRQCTSGARQEIEVLKVSQGREVILFQEQGRVRAEQFDQPRGFFRFYADAVGNGSIRMRLVPAVEFGEQQTRVIGGNGMYRYDTARSQRLFESLGITAEIPAGRTLVVSCAGMPKGIGGAFFGNRFESSSDHLLLLLRIAETPRDELFVPHEDKQPIVTPLE